MADLTAEEKKWVASLQRVISQCPSKRMAAYTTGNNSITLYNSELDELMWGSLDAGNHGDFCQAVDAYDAEFVLLKFPFPVHSTAG